MSKFISNNWYKFYKSLAVLLPLLATIIIAVADYYTAQKPNPHFYVACGGRCYKCIRLDYQTT